MSSLIQSIAADFSEAFGERLDFHEPADEFFDPLTKVLGDSPSKENAIALLHSGIPRLTNELKKWLEIEIDESLVRDAYHRAIRNFYGKL